MKKSFENLYYELEKNNNKLYEVWQKLKKDKKIILYTTVILIIMIDLLIILNVNAKNSSGKFIIALSIPYIIMSNIWVLIISFIITSIKSKKYNKAYKENIIDLLIKNFFSDVKYLPENKMPKIIYDEANYNEYYNRYYSDDYINAKLNEKYNIEMAEVQTVYETTHTDSEGNTTTERTTKFYGLFTKIEIDKSIENTLIIKTDGKIRKKDRLEMDSSEFEKYFDVSSENKIIGMQILTHDVMELLVNFRKKEKTYFDISIFNNIIYIRLHVGSIFEAKVSKNSIIDKEQTEKYYNILNFIETLSEKIVEVLNNTEI